MTSTEKAISFILSIAIGLFSFFLYLKVFTYGAETFVTPAFNITFTEIQMIGITVVLYVIGHVSNHTDYTQGADMNDWSEYLGFIFIQFFRIGLLFIFLFLIQLIFL